MTKYDFLSVGGGVIGLMTARRLVQREPRAKIAVFDGGLPGGASAAAAAMIAPYSEVTESLAQLSRSAARAAA